MCCFFCTDVDECLAIDNPCGPDPLAGCIDTEGSFACVCAEGYEWTGVLCQGEVCTFGHV